MTERKKAAPRTASAGKKAAPRKTRAAGKKAPAKQQAKAPAQKLKWTAERQEIFFRELAELCNVAAAGAIAPEEASASANDLARLKEMFPDG